MLVGQTVGIDDCLIERSSRSAFSRDFGRDPLENFGGQMRVYKDRQLRLPEHVNKTRGDHIVSRVDDMPGGSLGEVSDRGDSAAANAKIT